MKKLKIKDIIIIFILIFFLLPSLFSTLVIYQLFWFKQNKGLSLLNTISEVTKKDISEILILDGINSNFRVHSKGVFMFDYRIFLNSYECNIIFRSDIYNRISPESKEVPYSNYESIIEKNYELIIFIDPEKISNLESMNHVKKLMKEFIEKFKTTANNILIIDQINIFNKFIKRQLTTNIIDFPFLIALIWIPFISLIPSSYSLLFSYIWLFTIPAISLYLLKYLSIYPLIKSKIKKIILILLLIFLVINLISTYFIVAYIINIYKHLCIVDELSRIFFDWIRRGIPISIGGLIYQISNRIKFYSILGILLFLIIYLLWCAIPVYFASRIIFCLKPLFSSISYNSAILFLIFWILINYLLLIFLLKKIKLEKIYKIEIFFIPITFNACYFMSAADEPGIIVFFLYLIHFVILIVNKLVSKSKT